MRRYTLGDVGHRATMTSARHATVRKMRHSTVLPEVDLDGGYGETVNKVKVKQPYGLAYWLKPQNEEQQQTKQQQQTTTGGGGDQPGGTPEGGFSNLNRNQPKGRCAEGYIHYANGSGSHPYCENLGDARCQMILEDQEQSSQQGSGSGSSSSQEKRGTNPGATCLYCTREDQVEVLLHPKGTDENDSVKPGCYITTRNDTNHIVIQLVEPDQDEQQSQQQQANAGGSGTSGSGSSTSKDKGQRPLFRKTSDTLIEVVGDAVIVRRGNGYVKVTNTKVIGYVGDETKSFMATNQHTHIRHAANRIFVDAQGCWSTSEIQVKQDSYDT